MTSQFPPPGPQQQPWGPPAPPHRNPAAAKRPFLKRKGVIATGVGILAFLIGTGVGAAGASDVTASPEFTSMKDARSVAEKRADKLAKEVEETSSQLGGVDDREEAVKTANAKLKKQQAVTDARFKKQQVKMRKQTAALDKRAAKLSGAEKEAKSRVISGDGLYEVGKDIKAGTYKTNGPADGDSCYFAVLRDAEHPDDIVTNNNISGSGLVSVRSGQVLETNGCKDWTRQ